MLKDRETPKNPMAVANLEIRQVQSCRGGCFSKGVGRGFGDGEESPWQLYYPSKTLGASPKEIGSPNQLSPP